MEPSRTFRMTPQREVLLEELRKERWHPTADELYEVARRRLPRISLGTVYRNLELLAEQGLIQLLESGAQQKRYDGTAERHYHVRCLQCGRLDDVDLKTDLDLSHLVEQTKGYAIQGFLLEFMGICQDCQHANKEKKQ